MYIVDSTVVVPEEKADELIEIYQNRSRSVDQWEGFRSFQLLQNDKKPGELTVHMEWESKAHYMKWATSEEFQKIHELEKNYPDKALANIPPKVKKFKVVAE
ncbi:antibiotic biosynthesis monooxygenase [Pontibacillus chungwhensis BH030062]|uniref:Antibiotic biosynthesis monooxygenase n=2 Tax=Pontibacillus TaxID=289201 RepID=A0A0A2UYK4_9BACI|nr:MULTISPECIES: antibiotic biosynthesis monooxygenase family protein [Pontibacillus]KGP91616.1 antibiotic biosynthesis monooxygenase [Pontibacillus chungwhensis BH030062]QSS99478.1 antibiotic biosynthesis monooxygenase [Pontibacillus sp. ALD_SL1]GGD07055.1 antibiotic biosynthesis monooxygenase [Pontibacillus salipaludis]